MGISATGDSVARHEQCTDQGCEDQEILAELISPIVLEQADSISQDLLRNFGTLPRLLAAIDEGAEQSNLPSSVSIHLQMLKRLMSRLLRRDVAFDPILSSTDELLAYLHIEMSYLKRETVRVLFLDASNRLISEKIMWEGTVASVQCHPREIICAALQRHASALILVHNHPSGDPSPSQSDIEVTQELSRAAAYLGIILHDHIVVCASGHISMRAEGMLDDIAQIENNDAKSKSDRSSLWIRSLAKLNSG